MKYLSTIIAVVALVAVATITIFLFGFADYATNADLSAYAKKTDLNGLAKKSDIPNLKGYAKTADLPNFNQFATKTDLGNYAKKTDLPDMSGYVTYDSLASILSGYIKVSPDSGETLSDALLAKIFKAGDKRYMNMPGIYPGSVINKVMARHDSLKNRVSDLENGVGLNAEHIVDLERIQYDDDDDAESRVEARARERLSGNLKIKQ